MQKQLNNVGNVQLNIQTTKEQVAVVVTLCKFWDIWGFHGGEDSSHNPEDLDLNSEIYFRKW
jgi:hypothetical protein